MSGIPYRSRLVQGDGGGGPTTPPPSGVPVMVAQDLAGGLNEKVYHNLATKDVTAVIYDKVTGDSIGLPVSRDDINYVTVLHPSGIPNTRIIITGMAP